jgi:hypothetical protein
LIISFDEAKFKAYEMRIYQNYHKTKEAAFEKKQPL